MADRFRMDDLVADYYQQFWKRFARMNFICAIGETCTNLLLPLLLLPPVGQVCALVVAGLLFAAFVLLQDALARRLVERYICPSLPEGFFGTAGQGRDRPPRDTGARALAATLRYRRFMATSVVGAYAMWTSVLYFGFDVPDRIWWYALSLGPAMALLYFLRLHQFSPLPLLICGRGRREHKIRLVWLSRRGIVPKIVRCIGGAWPDRVAPEEPPGMEPQAREHRSAVGDASGEAAATPPTTWRELGTGDEVATAPPLLASTSDTADARHTARTRVGEGPGASRDRPRIGVLHLYVAVHFVAFAFVVWRVAEELQGAARPSGLFWITVLAACLALIAAPAVRLIDRVSVAEIASEPKRYWAEAFGSIDPEMAELAMWAYMDSLTRLHGNRSFSIELNNAIEEFIANKTEIVLIRLDVDHFKQLNDHLGYEGADQVLAQIGAILQAQCRKGTLAARQHGDEFAILMTSQSEEAARPLTERILATVARTAFSVKRIEGRLVRHLEQKITLSAGIATTAGMGGNVVEQISAELLDRATLRLQEAKRYRNAYCMTQHKVFGERPPTPSGIVREEGGLAAA